jgi:hypothetical protein
VTQSDQVETEVDISQLPSFKEPKSFLCHLGFHKWDVYSTSYGVQGGLCHTYNRCKRDCPHYNNWTLVDSSYPWE